MRPGSNSSCAWRPAYCVPEPGGTLIVAVASFHDLATVCQALAQTQSRLQMAQLVGEFLARLDADEAEVAARFMVGRALPSG